MQGFGSNRRLTLMDLVARLAMELSEPQRGTWQDVEYQYDLNNTQDLNELAWFVNIAQEFTCRQLYDKSFAFFESEFQHTILPGSNKYRLPSDFLAIESVFHYRGQDFCEMMETNIKEFERRSGYGSYDSFYSYYEVRGNVGTIVHTGQVPSSAASSEDTIAGSFDTTQVFVGDTVFNEIDGSTGQITSVTAAQIEVDQLSGGRTNTFEGSDPYYIESSTQPYECMRVFPIVSKVQEHSVHKGKPDNWESKYTRNITRLNFNIKSIPSDVNPNTERIYVTVQKADNTVAASGYLTKELKVGENSADMVGEIEGETKYFVRCAPKTASAFSPDKVEVFEAVGKDFLQITYTRLPKPMVKRSIDNIPDGESIFDPDAICEFPTYMADAIIAYAKILALQKKTGTAQVDPNSMSSFHLAVENILHLLRTRGESGNKNSFLNTEQAAGGRSHPWGSGWSGWTDTVLFP